MCGDRLGGKTAVIGDESCGNTAVMDTKCTVTSGQETKNMKDTRSKLPRIAFVLDDLG